MKQLFGLILILNSLYAWETTTHRAIDKEALKSGVTNLTEFVESMGIKDESYPLEDFDGYGMTYWKYIRDGEENGMSELEQKFSDAKYQSLIEAGTLLEDAQWPHEWFDNKDWNRYDQGDGRFLNHFYNPQDGGDGYLAFNNAIDWAYGTGKNEYGYYDAMLWFVNAFSLETEEKRRKYLAKMFVSVGHIMHMLNDMNVPAHTRSDGHPKHEPLEKYMRGGENHNQGIGFYYANENRFSGSYSADGNLPKRSSLKHFMEEEAKYTSYNFVSDDTMSSLESESDAIHPNKYDVTKQDCQYDAKFNFTKCYYVSNAHHKKVGIHVDSYLGEKLKIYTDTHNSFNGETWSPNTAVFDGDNSVLLDNAQLLVPRAIANARNFVNYFFRGSMNAEVNECGLTITNDSSPDLVAEGATTFQPKGKFKVYYDDTTTGTRKTLFQDSGRPKELTLEKPLAVGKTLQVPIIPKLRSVYGTIAEKKLIVVFEGDIGSEKGVSVAKVDISGLNFQPYVIKQGALEATFTWSSVSDIEMDFQMTDEREVAQKGAENILGVGLEHAYVESEFDMKPGDVFRLSAMGHKRQCSTLNEAELDTSPINLYARVKTPKGNYFKQFQANSFIQLNLKEFAQIEVKEYIEPEWICPALNDMPNWYNVFNQDTQEFQCIYCEEPYNIEWDPPLYDDGIKVKPGNWYCDRPEKLPPKKEDRQPVRDYCKDNKDINETCGCIPCDYIVRGMDPVAEFGPISEASVVIVPADHYGDHDAPVIYRGTTTTDEDILKVGLITITDAEKAKFENEHYYVISIEGGKDVDRNDDLVADANPTPNKGTIHAIIKGSDLKELPFRINVLTEAIYQVSGGLLGDKYDAEALSIKLDDAAKRLIKAKLYPTDSDMTINYRDILLWAPAVDKQTLYKPYEAYVEPIVIKTYANLLRFDESYTLIYEPYVSTAPLLMPLSLEVPQGLPSNTPIAKVMTQNGIAFSSMEIRGDYADHFIMDSDGTLRIKDTALLSEGNRYALRMRALDSSANSAGWVGLNINVVEGSALPRPHDSVPIFTSLETFEIVENSPTGTTVAKVTFVDSNRIITGYRLHGKHKDFFSVNSQGVVSVAQGADIDYEKSPVYSFAVSAYNDVGNEGYPIAVSIKVHNEIDTPLYPLVFLEHIEENTPEGTVVGKLKLLREGRSLVDSFEILSPSIPFTIDKNGIIRISSPIDFEQREEYIFFAQANTKHGKSNKIQCQIVVKNQEPERGIPSVKNAVIEANESIAPGGKIGQLRLDPGLTPVVRIALYGDDKNFRIDNNGVVYLAEHGRLDYEAKRRYDLGVRPLNSIGYGNEAHVVIIVKNISDEPPKLNSLRGSVRENATAGTLIGKISVGSSGESRIVSFALMGVGNEKFIIDNTGTVRTSTIAQFDYGKKRAYVLKATATTAAGTTTEADVLITVIKNSDPRPVLKPIGILVDENTTVGTVIGRMEVMTEGGSPIISYQASNTSLVTIDSGGTIRLNKALDYEEKRAYVIHVTASNAAGTSQPISMSLQVANIPEHPPILKPLNVTVEEDAPTGVIIGQIEEDDGGDSPITAYAISDTDTFSIDASGTIRLNRVLDYEMQASYVFNVTANNAAGKSQPVVLSIEVADAYERPPVLKSLTVTVDENTTVGSIIGHIEVETEGDSPITLYQVSDTALVSIDSNGTIRLNKALDHEAQTRHSLNATAFNKAGESQPVAVTIEVANIPDQIPVLTPLSVSIEENATVGILIGQISVDTEGDSPVATYRLGDTNTFSVNNHGFLRLVGTLDYESRQHYALRAWATNQAGESEAVTIDINVTNILEHPPILQPFREKRFYVKEMKTGNTIVSCSLVENNSSDNVADSYRIVSGNDNGVFAIDGNGIVATTIDFDYHTAVEYRLGIVATNAVGDSAPVDLIIRISREPFLIARKNKPEFEGFGGAAVGNSLIATGAFGGVVDDDEKGFVYIYQRENNSSVNEVAKITAPDGKRWDDFGSSIAISGNLIVVGAPGESGKGCCSGAAYLFEKENNGSIVELAKITASDGEELDEFGYTVAASGNFIAIGAYANNSNIGAVYLFKKENNGSIVELAKITASDGEELDEFGYTVAISGNLIIVGAPGESGKGCCSGAAYLFRIDGNGSVAELAKITASDGQEDDQFGVSLAISGNMIVVGAPGDNEYTGAAYLFEKESNNSIAEVAKITAMEWEPDDEFGSHITINEEIIFVSGEESKTTYLFMRHDGGVRKIDKIEPVEKKYPNEIGQAYSCDGSLCVFGGESGINIYDFNPDDRVYVYGEANASLEIKEGYVGHLYTVYAASPSGDINYMVDGFDGTNFDMIDNNLTLPEALDFENPLDDDGNNIYQLSIVLENSHNGLRTHLPIDVTVLKKSLAKEIGKLVAPNGDTYDEFGNSLAISGNLIVVGVPSESSQGEYSGAVYLFRKDANDQIALLKKITASDGKSLQEFGASVAISGNLIVVGTPSGHVQDIEAGTVYLFEKDSNDNIIELAKISASDGERWDRFGTSVAISDNLIVVGAPYENEKGTYAGAVYLFEKDNSGNVIELAKLTASDAQPWDWFGSTVAISGNLIIAGAPYEDEKGSCAGAAYLFEKDGNNDIVMIEKITASDGETEDFFGTSVAISSNLIIVGAPEESDKGPRAGAAYLFKKESNGSIVELTKIMAQDGEEDDNFGTSVAISGNQIVVGARFAVVEGKQYGATYLFEKDSNNIVAIKKLTASDSETGDNFGTSVAISDNLIVVGAPRKDHGAIGTGAVYVYKSFLGD